VITALVIGAGLVSLLVLAFLAVVVASAWDDRWLNLIPGWRPRA